MQAAHDAFGAQRCIAGVDEVGRGPIFGPVVAAAVILPAGHGLQGLRDSKKLSVQQRVRLALQIRERALAFQLVERSAADIDRLNILQASLLAMQQALSQLPLAVDLALIDGNRLPVDLPCPAQAVIGGDDVYDVIAAASILAKVERDQRLADMALQFPGYGLAKHKGYPTKAHLQALASLGPTCEHRQSFGPVKNWLKEHQ